MKRYVCTNDIVETVNLQDDYLRESFPVGIYTVKKNLSGFFLQKVDERFELPEKIYGSTLERTQKIKRTFQRRNSTTGVMLTGPKGTGKSLLAKTAANALLDEGYPVIRINDTWYGDDFNTFIQELGDCVLVFDEFAKVYQDTVEDVSYQAELLSLFDGMASSKKLILITENKYRDIDDLYKNRPSRVYYSWQYSGVEKEIIIGYCGDNLIDKDHLPNIIEISQKADEFSFDILQSIVEECNANIDTGISFEEFTQDLNLDITALITYMETIGLDQSGVSKGDLRKYTPAETYCELFNNGEFHCRFYDEKEKQNNTFYFNVRNAEIDGDMYVFNQERLGKITFRKVQMPTVRGGIWDAY